MTSRFLTPLVFKDDAGLPYELWLPLRYDSASLNREIVVPADFRTDLASIPRALWAVLPKSGAYDCAAVIHDFLYVTNGITRAQADDVLLEAMAVSGVSRVVRRLIWLGVRSGGWVPWGRYRQAQAQRT